MSKCTVKLQLEREDRVFRPGDPVRGTVQVTCNERCDLRSVVLKREWRTHGRGTADRDGPEDTVLATDLSLSGGATRSFSFEFEAPSSPLTYRGRVVNIDWYVRAEADMARAKDPRDEQEIIIQTARDRSGAATPVDAPFRPIRLADLPAGAIDRLQAVEPPKRFLLAHGTKNIKLSSPAGCAILGCLLVFVVLPALFFVGIFLTAFVEAVPGWLAGVVLLAIAAAIGYFVFRNRLAAQRLGQTQLKLASQTVRRGNTVDWFLACKPPRHVTIRTIVATLIRKEVASSGSGTNRRTHEEVVEQREMRLENVDLRAGEAVVFPGRFGIGADTACSFKGHSNEVRWDLKVRVDLPGWPDWSRTVPVEVVP
jgi:hypothetical protein